MTPPVPEAATPAAPLLRVAFGTIDAAMPGGIAATEHVFQGALERTGRVRAIALPYGRREPGEAPLRRVFQGMADLVGYARLVVRQRPDLVHLDSAFDRRALLRDAGYAIVSRALGQPLFFKLHGSDPSLVASRAPLWRALVAIVQGAAAGVGVLSLDEKNAFVAAGWPESKLSVVPNVVPWRRFEGGASPARDPLRLLFLARLAPTKGLRETVQALALVRARGRAVVLEVVGDGPERTPTAALASALGVAGAVRFHGQIPESETAAFYRSAGMLVFPTEREGFSMTIFQALAAGLPILTSRVNAAADHLSEPDTVLWIRPHDPEDVAEKIGRLLDHPELAARMAVAGPLLARTFDEDVVARAYLALYDSCLRSRFESMMTPPRAESG